MKKTLRTIMSLAFALLLVFQFAGSIDAHADSGQFVINVTGGSGTAPALKVGADTLADSWIPGVETNGIVISPADGVDYVVSVSIGGVDVSDELVATERNTVKVTAETVKDLGLTAPVAVEIVLDDIEETDYASVSYDDGDADIANLLTDGSTYSLVNQAFVVPSVTADAGLEAIKEEGREFKNWLLTYANGASMEVNAGDTVYPYCDFELEAQWNTVTSVSIRPVVQQKAYDGTAALVSDGSAVTDYEVYIYQDGTWKQAVDYTVSGLKFERTGATKDIVKVGGPYAFTASGATVKDASGKVIEAKYVFYEEGELYIYQRPVIIKANDTISEYTSEKLYPSGVTVDETTPLAANQSVDASSVVWATYSIRAGENNIAASSVIIRDALGNDVSENYDFTFETGLLKVTKRKITIAPVDTTVGYDGKAHTIAAEVTSGSLGVNDTLVLSTQPAGATEIGKYKDVKILGVDVQNSLVNASAKDSYEITWNENATADLEITGHYLKIRPKSRTAIYDGTNTPLLANDFEIVEGTLMEGHSIDTASLQYEGSITAVADGVGVTKYSNIVPGTVKVIDADGNDVTSSYKIDLETGTLRIEPIDLVIIAGSNSASYSGNPIYPDPEYTVVGNLLAGHKLVNVVVSGSQTYVGSCETKITSYDIVSENNNVSVKGNNYYRVTLNSGKLTIVENPNKPQPETVTVSIKSLTKTYDGKPLSLAATDYVITDTKGVVAANNITLKVTVDTSSSITNVGSKDIAAPTVKAYDANDREIPLQNLPFIIETKGGTLTVDPLVVTLTAASASKKYDGKALTCAKLADGGATVGNSTGKLVDGHTLNKNDIVYQGSQTNVGSSANKIVKAVIRDASGNDVSSNYKFVFIDGVLTVTSAAGTGTGTVAGGAASGDNSNIGLWIAIMAALAVAAAAVAFIVIKKRKAEAE